MVIEFIQEKGRVGCDGNPYLRAQDIEEFLGPVQFREFQKFMDGKDVFFTATGVVVTPENLFDFANRN